MRRSKILKSIEPPTVGIMEDIFGPVRTAVPHVRIGGERNYARGVGPAPGQMRGGRRRPMHPLLPNGQKDFYDFLFPPMPGAFQPSVIRKLPVGDRRDRYLKVLNATMGNHSMSLFYCDWSQAQFEAALNDDFKNRIMLAKSQLADRVEFIMNQGLGLIPNGVVADSPSYQITAALVKIAERLNERGQQQEAGKGYKLVIEGLERNKTGLPSAPEAKRLPQRDG